MYGLVAVGHFAVPRPAVGRIAPVDSPKYWFMMQIAVLGDFCTSYPAGY